MAGMILPPPSCGIVTDVLKKNYCINFKSLKIKLPVTLVKCEKFCVSPIIMHPRPPGRHIGIDSYCQLTTNFEFFELKIFVCRHVSIRGFQNRVYLSVVNISPTLVIDTSMERFSRVLHGNPKILISFQ